MFDYSILKSKVKLKFESNKLKKLAKKNVTK